MGVKLIDMLAGPGLGQFAGLIKALIFPGEEPPDFKKLMDKLSDQIQVGNFFSY